MNALDQMLCGEEPIVCSIAEDAGILAAEGFVQLFNNACMQVAGFEDMIQTVRRGAFLAPITNMSMCEH